MNRWFRFYDSVLDDPKVQRLHPDLFKSWINVLCIASRNSGQIPTDMADLGFALRMSEEDAADTLHSLAEAGLIDHGDITRPHNWGERQFQSDSSTDRVKRFRQRFSNGDGNAEETPNETTPEQSQNRAESEQRVEGAQARPSQKRGSRLPEGWKPSPAGEEFAKSVGVDPTEALAKFRDHWSSATGQKASKLDWDAAWRTWCRNEREFRGNRRPNSSPPSERGAYVLPVHSETKEANRLATYAAMIQIGASPGMGASQVDIRKLIKSGQVTVEQCQKVGCSP